jgi:hypothetical protein
MGKPGWAAVSPFVNPRAGHTAPALAPGGVYTAMVARYVKQVGILGENIGSHALRAAAATEQRVSGHAWIAEYAMHSARP